MNDRAIIRPNATLFDKTIGDVQVSLTKSLKWLNFAFGNVVKLVERNERGKFVTPSVYFKGNDYLRLEPDDKRGNVCFFYMHDSQDYEGGDSLSGFGDLRGTVSIIFWFDTRKIPGAEYYNVEFVKSEILRALTHELYLPSGDIQVRKIFHDANNVYKEFSIQKTDNQYYVYPYACLRFECDIHCEEGCY